MISVGDDDDQEKMQIYIFSIGIYSFHYDEGVDNEDDNYDDDGDNDNNDNGDDDKNNHRPC